MWNNLEIDSVQFKILIIMFSIGSAILVVPSVLALDAQQDAWMGAIIGTVGGVLLIWLYCALGKRFPQQSLIEFSELIMGRWIGTAINIMFFIFSFLLAGMLLKYMGDFITTKIMPDTPIHAIIIIVMLVVLMAVAQGLSSIARAAQIFFPWTIILLGLLFLLILPEVDFRNIEPMFESGFKMIFHSSIHMLSVPYFELILFLTIYPYVKQSVQQRNRAMVIAGWFGGAVLTIITLLTILVLGSDLAERSTYPSFSLAKRISIGHFIERLEAIVGAVWFVTLYFKVAFCFYISALKFAQIFRLKDYRSLLLPFAIILIVLTQVIYPNIVYSMNFIVKIWPSYSLIYGFLIPLLFLVVAKIRKIKGTENKQ